MLSNSRYKKFVITALFLAIVFSSPVHAGDLRDFLSNIPAGDALIGNTKIFNTNSIYAVSRAKFEGALYSLVVVKVPEDDDPELRTELEITAQNRAKTEAQARLALYILPEGDVIDRKLFIYDDALGSVLLSYYGLKGMQTSATVLNKFAYALSWIDDDTAERLKLKFASDIPNILHKGLSNDYCRFLYRNRARILFEAGRYDEALPVFKNIHEFRWADVNAYLDACECFLRTGNSDDCIKLLHELILTLDSNITSENFKRAGRLFREAGDKDSAREAFIKARQRLHEENKKN